MPPFTSSVSSGPRGTSATPAAPHLSRRECLGAIATSALLTLPGMAHAQDTPAAGWIDAHSHIWTSDVAKYPLAGNQTADDLKPRDFTDEQLIAEGRPHGVTRFVLIQHADGGRGAANVPGATEAGRADHLATPSSACGGAAPFASAADHGRTALTADPGDARCLSAASAHYPGKTGCQTSLGDRQQRSRGSGASTAGSHAS